MVLMLRGRPLTPRRVVLWVLLSLLAALAVYLRIAWSAGRAELSELCERDQRPKVYKKVSAAGYYEHRITCINEGCWEILTRSPYRFIEFENDRVHYFEPLKEVGFYRASKVRADSGNCDPRLQSQLENRWALQEYHAAGNCIQIEKLDSPTASYGLFVDRLPPIRLDNMFGSVIKRLHTYIKDMQTGEIIAEQTGSMLFQRSMPAWGSFENMLHCRTRGIMSDAKFEKVGEVTGFITPE